MSDPTNTRQEELKPCPFCGGDAIMTGGPDCGWVIECEKVCTSHIQSESTAIAAWNTRSGDSGMGDGWRPIAEAPRDELVLLATSVGVVASVWDESSGCFGNDYVEYDCATHWAPMPAPPAGEG